MTFCLGLHLILGGKLDVTLSVSRVRLRQSRISKGSAAWHGLRNTALESISSRSCLVALLRCSAVGLWAVLNCSCKV